MLAQPSWQNRQYALSQVQAIIMAPDLPGGMTKESS